MRRLTPLAAFLAAFCVLPSTLAQVIHFSPEERLDTIDAALIATAKHSIDLVGRHSKIGGMDGRSAQKRASADGLANASCPTLCCHSRSFRYATTAQLPDVRRGGDGATP